MPNFTPTDFLRDLHISSRVGIFAIIFAIIFSAAMIGVLSRPLFFLASFWPANALLLGLIRDAVSTIPVELPQIQPRLNVFLHLTYRHRELCGKCTHRHHDRSQPTKQLYRQSTFIDRALHVVDSGNTK